MMQWNKKLLLELTTMYARLEKDKEESYDKIIKLGAHITSDYRTQMCEEV